MRKFLRAAAALLLSLGVWSTAVQAQPLNIYGGELTTHILVPWFEAGPLGAPSINTLWGITNANRDASATIIVNGQVVAIDFIGVHVRLWDVNSVEACDVCLPITREDIYVDDIASFVATYCNSPATVGLLDPDGDGLLKGYATVESTLIGTGNECGATIPFPLDLLWGQIYHVQLADGQTDGIAAPGFFLPVDAGGLLAFPLPEGASLWVRFLTGLGDPDPDPTAAFTRLVVWSATSTACGTAITPVPDAQCLDGGGAAGLGTNIRLCDDEEDCISQPKPLLSQEVNFFLVDTVLPVTFDTPSGWFELVSDPSGLLLPPPLQVLAYSFQETVVNSSVIFPVPRDFGPAIGGGVIIDPLD